MVELTNKEVIRDNKGRYVKGQSGNPYANGGRPIGSVSLVQILRQRLNENPQEAKEIVNAFIDQGKAKDMRAIEELLNRIDGKVAERHKIEAEIPIRLVFVPAETLQDGQEGQGNGNNDG